MNQEGKERWIPWALVVGVVAILAAHVVPWMQLPITARTLRVQQNFLESLMQYERLLTLFDDNLRAQVFASDRPELRERKQDIIRQVREQLETLVEAAPSDGPIVPALLELASHWKGKVIPESKFVETQARAPGDWGSLRFRYEYGHIRGDHAQRIHEISSEARKLTDGAFNSAQQQIFISAGVCLLLWSTTLTGLVIREHRRARLRSAHQAKESREHPDAHHTADPHSAHTDEAHESVTAIATHEADAHSEVHAAAASVHTEAMAPAETPVTHVRAEASVAASAIMPAVPAVATIPTPAPMREASAAGPTLTETASPTPTPPLTPPPVAATPTAVLVTPAATPAPQVAEAASSGGDMSTDDIAALLAGATEPEPATATASDAADQGGSVDVEALLKAVEQQEANIPIPQVTEKSTATPVTLIPTPVAAPTS